MNRREILNHIILFIVLVMIRPSISFSQTDTLARSQVESSVQTESTVKKNSLYTGIGAGSNMIYLGTSISNNKPFYSASVTYGLKNTLFVSAAATHLNETSPYVAFYNLALNYSHTFNSWFDISTDIAGYKTAESLRDSLFSDFMYINLTAGFDWKLIYTRVSFSGIISQMNGYYLQVSNSRYFETREFLKGKAIVYFNPDIDILFGNMISVENVSGNKKYGNAPPFSHAGKKTGSSSEVLSEKFGLIDFQFSLPVTFSYGKVSFEAEPGYLLSFYSNAYYTQPEGFTFHINIIFKVL
jgi:hypothetical protein